MDKRKLKEVYDSIRDEIESMNPGGCLDFGAGSYQDGTKIMTVRRGKFDIWDKSHIYYVNDKPVKKTPKATAIVYRTIIDEVTEYGTNHNFF